MEKQRVSGPAAIDELCEVLERRFCYGFYSVALGNSLTVNEIIAKADEQMYLQKPVTGRQSSWRRQKKIHSGILQRLPRNFPISVI